MALGRKSPIKERGLKHADENLLETLETRGEMTLLKAKIQLWLSSIPDRIAGISFSTHLQNTEKRKFFLVENYVHFRLFKFYISYIVQSKKCKRHVKRQEKPN